MAHAYSYDFSAHFKNQTETALDKFRARDAGAELAARALPADPGQREGYVLFKSAPDVAASEVEQAGTEAVEITVLWGANVLHVAHLTPARNFSIGDVDGADFLLPSDKLGTDKLPLIMVENGCPSLVVPAGAQGDIELPGADRLNLVDAAAAGQAVAEVAGARRIPLAQGARATVRIGDFTFKVGVVTAGKRSKHGLFAGWDRAVAAYFSGAFLVQGALMAGLAFFVPPLGLTDDEDLDRDRLIVMQQFVKSAAEREQEEKKEQVQDGPSEKEGGTGERAQGAEGSMGKATAKATNAHWAKQGPKDNPDPQLSRTAALHDAATFGMIGLLSSMSGDPNSPTSPWGRDAALGRDDVSANGNMWGDEIGDAFGSGGLGLSGIGEGGGGRGEGIGLGNIGFGRGAGLGLGQGFGNGIGFGGRGHKVKSPTGVRIGEGTVSGRLPKEVIQRIVRQNYGRFRMCYEQGLTRNPNLEGRVSARFVIGRDGAVSNVMNGGSDLPDSGTTSCVLSAFYGLSFPQPEGGIVTVSYPIMFTPGG